MIKESVLQNEISVDLLKCRAFVVSRTGRKIKMDHEGELKGI